jgi:hypothetical protein
MEAEYVMGQGEFDKARRLSRKEEEYFKESCVGACGSKPLIFGRFLIIKGLITEQDIVNARLIQRQQNLMIGELARRKGWITGKDIERVLVFQEENPRPFGELAVEHEYLHKSQVAELLKEIELNHLFLGEALVSLGALTRKDMLESLEIFGRLRETDRLAE